MNTEKQEWEDELLELHCINGAMYFGSVESPCSGRDRGECCFHEQTFEEAEKELKSFISEQIEKERNKVLDEVKSEVDKTPIGYLVMSGKVDDEDAPGYSQCRKDISTIIESLKVK